MALPPCGIYKTTAPIGNVPAGRLVYFHNHGDPGPGIYLPLSWNNNRARFDKRGTTLPDDDAAHTLEPIPSEGLYVVRQGFTCCELGCRTFEEGALVQVGYNGAAEPIIFLPAFTETGLVLPDTGSKTSLEKLSHLEHVKVAENREQPALVTPPADQDVH